MTEITKIITNVNDFINGLVWGWPALILLGITGVIMTILTKCFQVSHWGHWWKNTLGAIFKDKHVTGHTSDKTISQFQSLCTALAATVGTGNIVGVAGAIYVGGPGAVFWMWLIAFFGMMTNYSENVLGILYRRKDKEGAWHGGAMYYLRDGLGGKKNLKTVGAVLAILFSVFCLLASFGIGNMSQVNSMSSNIQAAIANVASSATKNPGWEVPVFVPYIIGALLFAAVAAVILGGLKRIAAITEKLVPFMVIIYLIGAIVIICINITAVPAIFVSIFKGAFALKSVGGGIVGAGIAQAMKMGFKRGVFSNEAGLGSSVMVHSSSNVKEPVRQGMWGIFEVFADTIIVCTLTALVILGAAGTGTSKDKGDILIDLATGQNVVYTVSEAEVNDAIAAGAVVNGDTVQVTNEDDGIIYLVKAEENGAVVYHEQAVKNGAPVFEDDGVTPVVLTKVEKNIGGSSNLMSYSFSKVFGPVGSIFIALAILLFAYSTVLGWSHYGTTAVEYLFGKKGVWPYRIVFVVLVFLGAIMEAQLAWDISDTFNGLMMLPNLVGVLVLSPQVVKTTRNYVNRHFKGSKEEAILSMIPEIQKTQEEAFEREGDEE